MDALLSHPTGSPTAQPARSPSLSTFRPRSTMEPRFEVAFFICPSLGVFQIELDPDHLKATISITGLTMSYKKKSLLSCLCSVRFWIL